jgi:hypothetical protein
MLEYNGSTRVLASFQATELAQKKSCPVHLDRTDVLPYNNEEKKRQNESVAPVQKKKEGRIDNFHVGHVEERRSFCLADDGITRNEYCRRSSVWVEALLHGPYIVDNPSSSYTKRVWELAS